MADNEESAPAGTDPQTNASNVRLRYDSMDTTFASQFIVNASREEIILNLSPGYIAEPGSGDRLLPIQSRIAMTPQGAARLVQTLNTVLRNSFSAKSGDGPDDSSAKSND